MNVTHWVPNQFEPALPNAPQLETDISDANADQNTLEEKPDTPEMKAKKDETKHTGTKTTHIRNENGHTR